MLMLASAPTAPGTPAPVSAAAPPTAPKPAPAGRPIEERDFPVCPTGTIKRRSVDGETSRVFLYCEGRVNGRTINQGPLWTFFPSGQIESRFVESASGRCRHGSERWHANGVRAELVETRDCGKQERRRAWYPNGQPRLDEVRDRGELHGARRRWNAKGILLLEAELNHGTPNGLWKAWYDNGRMAMLATFADGRAQQARW
jgi:antitoxin component YwqK of YwqJK toxin-antitoxin module